MRNNRFENFDVNNCAPRVPVLLLLDTSISMDGAPIYELQKGLTQFIHETVNDEAASMSVELEVITFDTGARISLPFTPITHVNPARIDLSIHPCTDLGAALTLANSEMKRQRAFFKSNGVSSYRPWVILMTDGGPNDEWEYPAAEMRALAERGKIIYIGLEIGDEADHRTMCQIMPAQPGPIKLKELRFKNFFRWVTDSLNSVSSSTVAEENQVRFGSIRSWADLSV